MILTDEDFLALSISVFSFATVVFMSVLFWIHRKNTKERIEKLEEIIHDRDNKLFMFAAEEIDNFKKALQQHLTEISERVRDNEMKTNKLHNNLDEIRTALLEDSMSENGHNLPDNNE